MFALTFSKVCIYVCVCEELINAIAIAITIKANSQQQQQQALKTKPKPNSNANLNSNPNPNPNPGWAFDECAESADRAGWQSGVHYVDTPTRTACHQWAG